MIQTVTTFGDYQPKPESEEYLCLCFSASSLPLQQLWRNNGLSADFLADYFVTFFPAENGEAQQRRQTEVRAAIAYIANELLENAMKYSQTNRDTMPASECGPIRAVSFGVHLRDQHMIFYVSNLMDGDKVQQFQELIDELLHCDIEARYFAQLEHNALAASSSNPSNNPAANDHSFMGFLTMIHDYNARLGWRFEGINSETARVTTMVELAV